MFNSESLREMKGAKIIKINKNKKKVDQRGAADQGLLKDKKKCNKRSNKGLLPMKFQIPKENTTTTIINGILKKNYPIVINLTKKIYIIINMMIDLRKSLQALNKEKDQITENINILINLKKNKKKRDIMINLKRKKTNNINKIKIDTMIVNMN
jgi:hypothetical protein